MSKLTESLRKWSDTFSAPDHPFTGQIAQLLAAAADAVDRLETVNHTLSGQIQKAIAELQDSDRENRRLRAELAEAQRSADLERGRG